MSLVIAYDKAKPDTPIILTDDGALDSECHQTNRKILLLPVFLLTILQQGLISKNAVAKCLKHWEKNGSYKQKFIKRWKLELQNIH